MAIRKEPAVTVTESVPSLTVNVPTAAQMLGISRGYAFELAKRGELPGIVKLGGRYVVSRRVLEETINGKLGSAA
jgi:predicted DNA-binding transcriptional regulator AlpA